MSQNPETAPEYNMVASDSLNPPTSQLPEQLGNLSIGGNNSSTPVSVPAPVLTAEEIIIRSFESFTQEERAGALAYLSNTYNLRERSPHIEHQELRNQSPNGQTQTIFQNPPATGTNASYNNNYPMNGQTRNYTVDPATQIIPPGGRQGIVGRGVHHDDNNSHNHGYHQTNHVRNTTNNHGSQFLNDQAGRTGQNYYSHGNPPFDHETRQNLPEQNYYSHQPRGGFEGHNQNGQNSGINAQQPPWGHSQIRELDTGRDTGGNAFYRVSLKFPEPKGFDGSRDQQKVEEFLYQAERYTKFYGLTGARAVDTVTGYFRGKATTWWRLYTRHNSNPENLEIFADLLRDKFIPKTAKRNLKDKLEKLKQYGSVAKFNSEFRDMLLELPDLYTNEEDLIHKYLNKLKGKTRVEVEWKITDEDNLESVMDLAERYDNIIYSQGTIPFVRTRPNASTSSRNDPMDIDNSQLSKLTDQQRDFLIKNKGCFKCRKLGHFSRDCTMKIGINNIGTDTNDNSEETIEEEYERLFGEELDDQENNNEAPTS